MVFAKAVEVYPRDHNHFVVGDVKEGAIHNCEGIHSVTGKQFGVHGGDPFRSIGNTIGALFGVHIVYQ